MNKGITTNILVEVNVGKEESKSGIYLEGLDELLLEIAEMPNIKINGLMTIPPICDSEKEVSRYFETMHNAFVDIREKKYDNVSMECLSMGMSDDFTDAIAEGSTMVRIGTAIFGKRNYNI